MALRGLKLTWKPQQNGFGRRFPSRNNSQHSQTSGMLLEKFRTAAMRGNIDTIDECLKNGIAVDQLLKCDWTALMYAATDANPAFITFLLDHGADPNFHKDFYTVLMAACSSKRDEKLVLECVEMLIEKKAAINAEDRYHVTPLINASREGHVSVVEKLLDSGATINKQDSRGYTALSWATHRKQKGVIKLLLQYGADPLTKHADGLMARDLALGNDEIISLLEGYKMKSSYSSSLCEVSSSESEAKSAPFREIDGAADSFRQFDSRHGEVEVFLYGLDLGELVPLFQEQHVEFETFLRMTEQDLINMKITQIGWRKKILDGIQAVHKKDWEATSLLSAQYNKHIGCADAIAMVANISKHLRYVASTVGYIHDQIKVHPTILGQIKDGTGPLQLRRHMEDTVRNVARLSEEIDRLQTRLNVEIKDRDLNPPDIIQKKKANQKWSRRKLTFISLTVIATGLLVWNRRSLSRTFIVLLQRGLLDGADPVQSDLL